MGKEGKPGMFFLNISVFFLSTISKEGECSREGFGSPLDGDVDSLLHRSCIACSIEHSLMF